MGRQFLSLLAFGILCLGVQLCYAETTVTYITGESLIQRYWANVIKLALEETKPTYGDFVFDTSKYLTSEEQYGSLIRNNLTNFVVIMDYKPTVGALVDLTYIPFPVELGILGWRICFTHKQAKARVAEIKTLDDLRKFSIVQGLRWTDNDILRKNKLNITEAPAQNLLKMMSIGRADLFCRGVNELYIEWENNKNLPNIDYDESFVMVYKMPLFIYMHKNNMAVKKRIEEGIAKAYKDGSLMKMWLSYFGDALKFSKVQQRRVIPLENDIDASIPKEYERFLIDPLTLKIE